MSEGPPMVTAIYRLIDRTVAVSLPEDIHAGWDLLYGKLRRPPTEVAEVHLAVEACDGDGVTVRMGDRAWTVPRTHVLMYLQSIVQNQLLPASVSCLLWHGALWEVGGRGLLLLAESGTGKTTLSLAHLADGGRVLSDELAIRDVSTGLLRGWPRAMAARPDSLGLCGIDDRYPRLRLDEEKVLVPLPDAGDEDNALPLAAVVFLEWDADPQARGDVVEIRVEAVSGAWRGALRETYPGIIVEPHPDGGPWWRCHGAVDLVKPADLPQFLADHGAVLSGFHDGAFRRPSYAGAARCEALVRESAAARALPHLINRHALARATSPLNVMGHVHAMLREAPCWRCVPGELKTTLAAVRNLLTNDSGLRRQA